MKNINSRYFKNMKISLLPKAFVSIKMNYWDISIFAAFWRNWIPNLLRIIIPIDKRYKEIQINNIIWYFGLCWSQSTGKEMGVPVLVFKIQLLKEPTPWSPPFTQLSKCIGNSIVFTLFKNILKNKDFKICIGNVKHRYECSYFLSKSRFSSIYWWILTHFYMELYT